jgi:hypothetical protein
MLSEVLNLFSLPQKKSICLLPQVMLNFDSPLLLFLLVLFLTWNESDL